MRFRLKIAGAGKNKEIINAVKSVCDDKIEIVGSLNGKEKVEFIANAKAIILYTLLPDAAPLVIMESLISGTPIVGSTNGSLPELIPNNCGILCKNEQELSKAIYAINKIKPIDCRNYALDNYSNVVSAKKCLQLFEDMVNLDKNKGV